jgi:hypothetical protein|tara:strand:- start:1260 stop:2003 length:744 start_codon:yes stop_codon:yes gene_type:complete
MNIMKNAALEYIRAGYSIMPISSRTKKPIVGWTEYQKKPASEKLVLQWWTKHPNASIGLITGEVSGVTVVDVDKEKQGLSTLKALKLPMTRIAKTGSGGFHYYYQYTDHVYTKAGVLQGIDIRNNGGFVVVPPSLHENGKRYEWVLEEDFYPFPKSKFPKMHKQKGEWKKLIAGVPEGQRNDSTASFIGGLMNIFPPYQWEDNLWKLLRAWNTFNSPPISEDELRRTFESIGKTSLLSTWKDHDKMI